MGRTPSAFLTGSAHADLDESGVTGRRLRLDRLRATAGRGYFPPAGKPPLHRETK